MADLAADKFLNNARNRPSWAVIHRSSNNQTFSALSDWDPSQKTQKDCRSPRACHGSHEPQTQKFQD
jgi:hypothetical protein